MTAGPGPNSTGPASRHCYGILPGPLRRAIKDRIIENPCIDIALPKKPDRRKTFDDVLTAEEVDRLVDAIIDRTPAMQPCPPTAATGHWCSWATDSRRDGTKRSGYGCATSTRCAKS